MPYFERTDQILLYKWYIWWSFCRRLHLQVRNTDKACKRQWSMLLVTGNSKIMHCGIVFNKAYWYDVCCEVVAAMHKPEYLYLSGIHKFFQLFFIVRHLRSILLCLKRWYHQRLQNRHKPIYTRTEKNVMGNPGIGIGSKANVAWIGIIIFEQHLNRNQNHMPLELK